MNELFAHHTKHHVEHHQKHTTPTVKPTGDSILLCGGFSVASPGWLVTVQGGANAAKCREILEKICSYDCVFYSKINIKSNVLAKVFRLKSNPEFVSG